MLRAKLRPRLRVAAKCRLPRTELLAPLRETAKPASPRPAKRAAIVRANAEPAWMASFQMPPNRVGRPLKLLIAIVIPPGAAKEDQRQGRARHDDRWRAVIIAIAGVNLG